MKKVITKELLGAIILGLTAQNTFTAYYWEQFKSKLPSWQKTAAVTGTAGALGYGGKYLVDQSIAAEAASMQRWIKGLSSGFELSDLENIAKHMGLDPSAIAGIDPNSYATNLVNAIAEAKVNRRWGALPGDYLRAAPGAAVNALRGLGRGTQYLGSGLGTGLGYAGSAASGLWNYLPGKNAYASKFGDWAAEKGANLVSMAPNIGMSSAWNALPAETQQALIGAATLAAIVGAAGYGYKQGWFSKVMTLQELMNDLIIPKKYKLYLTMESNQLKTLLTAILNKVGKFDNKSIDNNIQLLKNNINTIDQTSASSRIRQDALENIVRLLKNTISLINSKPLEKS